MRFFVYCRKSVIGIRGESIANQLEVCKSYIDSRLGGGELVAFEDEGYSGKSLDRPEFARMLARLRSEKPDFLVCYRLDRISRSVSDFSSLIEELDRLGVGFVCVSEEFDTSKPMGKAMMYIASVFAQLERETIAERVRDNMLLLARSGRWLGGTPPTGYISEKLETLLPDGRKQRSCRLRENPEELALVRRIFSEYLNCGSIAEVIRNLERDAIRSRSGKRFSTAVISQLLRNPVYCTADSDAADYFEALGAQVCFDANETSFEKRGLIAYNKSDCRKKGLRLPPQQWIIAVGTHGGLISGEDFARVQLMLARKLTQIRSCDGSSPMKSRKNKSGALFSGRIFCGCGSRMLAKPRSDGSEKFDYICERKLRQGRAVCAGRNLPGKQTDQRILSRLAAENLRFDQVKRIELDGEELVIGENNCTD